jgi:N-acetylmuramoyl-L-alanine amidase
MNIIMKSFVVACAATMSISMQNHAEAITQKAIQHKETLQLLNQPKGLTFNNQDGQADNVINTTIQSVSNIVAPQENTIVPSKPVIKAAVTVVGLLADNSKTVTAANVATETAAKTNAPTESDETVVDMAKTEETASQPTEATEVGASQEIEPVETAAQRAAETDVQPVEPKAEVPTQQPAAPAVSISQSEKDLFARLVEAEAKGEPYEGKVAVATVVLNRVDSPEFPDSVTEVIKEKVGKAYAFSPVQNGEINKPASEESKKAVEEALKREDTLDNSIYFYNPEIATDNWIRTRDAVETIGNHVFAK